MRLFRTAGSDVKYTEARKMKGALWCVVLCAVLGIATADDPVGICGLDGFDLNVLHL